MPARLDSASAAADRPAVTPRHFPYIDGLRALCALYVLLCHAWYQPANGYYAQRWLNKLGMSYAHLAVDVFIVVSGFVIILPIAARGDQVGPVTRFLKRRARRILPPFYAALLLTIAFILLLGHERTGTVWDSSLPLTWKATLANLALVQNWVLRSPRALISYQLWSIAVEWQIYLLVPLLVLGVSRLGYWLTCLIAVAGSVALTVTHDEWRSIHHWFIALFLFGAGAARLVVRAPNRAATLGIPGLAILLVTCTLIAIKGHHWWEARIPFLDLPIGVGSALLIAALSSSAQSSPPVAWLAGALSWRPLVKLGAFSYSLYLVHPMLLHCAWLFWNRTRGNEPVGMYGLLLLSCPAIVAASFLFHLAFERPFMSAPSSKAREAGNPSIVDRTA
jgi:peptidoglycan/LPS O-acetylase OafA/YrhL